MADSKKTPTAAVGEKIPTVAVAEKTPTAAVAEKTPTAAVSEKTPTATHSNKTPTASDSEKTPTMADSEKICRFCLKPAPSSECSPLNESLLSKLNLLIPDIKLVPSNDPVICKACNNMLETTHKQKRTCASSNKLVKFLKNYSIVTYPVDLQELMRGHSKKQGDKALQNQSMCRICVKSHAGTYISFEKAKKEEFGEVISACLPIADEKLTTNPVICNICIALFRDMHNFIKQLTDIENTVKSYSEKYPGGPVDLSKVIEPEITDESDFWSEFKIQDQEEASDRSQVADETPSKDESVEKGSPINETTPRKDEKVEKDSSPGEMTPRKDETVKNSSPDGTIPHKGETVEKDSPVSEPQKPPSKTNTGAELKPRELELLIEDQKMDDVTIVDECMETEEDHSESESITEDQHVEINMGTGELPFFDFTLGTLIKPYRRKVHIEDWIKQVEEIKSKLNWSDAVAKHKILGMMDRLSQMQQWLTSVADVTTWDEWKERLVNAFPGKNDYYTNFLKMCERRKRSRETFVEYYNVKLALLEPLDLKGEQAVSCLLGGIGGSIVSSIGRMEKYKTPDELLVYFKSSDEKNLLNLSPAKGKKTKKPQGTKPIHSSIGTSKELIVLLEKKKIDPNLFNISPTKKTEQQPGQKCSCCDQTGHSNLNCPLIKASNTPQSKNSGHQKVIVHADVVLASPKGTNKNQSKPVTNSTPQKRINSTGIAAKVAKLAQQQSSHKPNQAQKCVCCDKLGHTSVDCPLIKGKSLAPSPRIPKLSDRVQTPQKTDKNENKCSYCDKVGHTTAVCPLIKPGNVESNKNASRSNIKIVLDKDRLDKNKIPTRGALTTGQDDLVCEVKQNKDVSFQKKNEPRASRCSCCDKIGHVSLNCPLIRNKGKGEAGRDQKNQNRDRNDAGKTSQNKNTTQSSQKCSLCDKYGHSGYQCRHKSSKSDTASRNTDKASNDKSKVQHSPAENKNSSRTSQKCLSCNQVGHTIFDCHLNKHLKQTKPNTDHNTSQSKSMSQTTQKCLGCNQVGHTVFDCHLNKHLKQNTAKPNTDHNTSQSKNTTQKCLSCNQVGHTIFDCPLNKHLKQSAAKPNTDHNTSQNKSMSQTTQKCLGCNQMGHTVFDCHLNKHLKQNTPKTYADQNLSQSQSMSQATQKCLGCNQVGHNVFDCHLNRHLKQKQNSSQNKSTSQTIQKCLGCNQMTHTIFDCPLLKNIRVNSGKPYIEPKPSPIANIFQAAQKCLGCNQTDHSSFDCPLLGIKNVQSATSNTQEKNMSRRTQRCLGCDQSDHTSVNCPLLNTGTAEDEFVSSYSRNSPEKCLCCNKTDHSSLDCPLISMDRRQACTGSDTGVDSSDASAKDSNRSRPEKRRNEATSEQTCTFCNKQGHTVDQCEFVNFFRKPTTGTSDVVASAKDQLQKALIKKDYSKQYDPQYPDIFLKPSQESSRTRSKDFDEPPQKKSKDDSTESCYFCNQPGHASANCAYRDRGRNELARLTMYPSCEFCHRIGHGVADCYDARLFERKVYESRYSGSVSRQCLNCGKFGHPQSDCPKIKRKGGETRWSLPGR